MELIPPFTPHEESCSATEVLPGARDVIDVVALERFVEGSTPLDSVQNLDRCVCVFLGLF